MTDSNDRSRTSSTPIAEPPALGESPNPSFRADSPLSGSLPRHIATARLASPIPGNGDDIRQAAVPQQALSDYQFNKDASVPSSVPRHGESALRTELRADSHALDQPEVSPERSPERIGSPPATDSDNHDSIRGRSASQNGTGLPTEDPEIVRRHLVQPQNGGLESPQGSSTATETANDNRPGIGDDEFSSLQLQGGDITRPVYRWAEEAENQERRRSFSVPRPDPEAATLDINSIKVPGGFRRDYLRRTAGSPEPHGLHGSVSREQRVAEPRLPTNNFLEFLTLFGHFAGEELEEDDEALGPDEYFTPALWEAEEGRVTEETALLPPTGKHPRRPKERAVKATNTTTGAILLLLKSFVGTGVLFLPRAFLNGGMLFSSGILVGVSILSYYCFILLVNTRMKVEGSFGDMGGALYGKHMRRIILGSIALSQFGFVSAYIVFVSTNLQAFVLAVSKCKTFIDIKLMILMQLVIFLPLSLIRDISKLGFTALIADAFILLGIVYLYGVDIKTIADQGGVADIKAFNPVSWTLLIGTAIFTYEGIGLIIPIQESMKRPEKFPKVLALVMGVITVVFLSSGVLGYATFGSKTETVVLLNLPQDDKFVNGVQFLYSAAILLSTPLQLFPAIRILENGLFTRSGKYNPGIKWKKNIFRFFLVFICGIVAWAGADDLDKFVALVGSFACVPLVYVYPPMLHYKAVATSRWQRVSDIVLAVFGVIVCAYTTVLTVTNWASGAGEPKGPGHCSV